jgi:hypothetical protein
MAAKLTILAHKIAIHLHLVADSYAISSSCYRLPVLKLLDEPSYKCSGQVLQQLPATAVEYSTQMERSKGSAT